MRVTRYKKGRYWAVLDPEGRLVCICVYRKGAREVVRRLTEPEAVARRSRASAAGSDKRLEAEMFPLGQVVATPGALEALRAAGQTPEEFLVRHHRSDWGEVDAEDWARNEAALLEGTRLLSAYRLRTGERLWILTEADRSRTTLLLPRDY